ncbi:hypothetical protein F4703DRAFT_1733230 [Phycomyces blakesleeanus]
MNALIIYHQSPRCLQNNLGFPYKDLKRELPFDIAVNNEYKELPINKIIITSNDLRNIIFRAMMFINSYCLAFSRDSIPNSIYKQAFWYSVCQLVNRVKVTKSANVPPDLVQSWDTHRASITNSVYNQSLQSESRQFLSEACTELATCYTNYIVENFEKRLLSYLRYTLQNLLVVKFFSEEYCYQFVCGGDPSWPSRAPSLEELQKSSITNTCRLLKSHLPDKVTLAALSAHPEKHISVFLQILSEYELEHTIHNPFDARWLPLPRLFGLFSKPSFHFRSITISANSRYCFVSRPLSRGCNNQLLLFKSLITLLN